MTDDNNTDRPTLSDSTASLLAKCMNLVAQPVTYTDQLVEKLYQTAKALSEMYGDELHADYNSLGGFSIYMKHQWRDGTTRSDVISVSDGALKIHSNYSILVSATRDYLKTQSSEWFHDSRYGGDYGYYTNGVTYKVGDETFSTISFPIKMVIENNILEEILGRYIDLKDKSYKKEGASFPDNYTDHMKQIAVRRSVPENRSRGPL